MISAAPTRRTRPLILLGGRDLRDVTANAVEAIVMANEPNPTLFEFGDSLARLRHIDGRTFIEVMAVDLLANHLSKVADWRTIDKSEDGRTKFVACYPDKTVIRDVLAEPNRPLPRIDRIVTAPTFSEDGSLVDTEGYHPDARIYLSLDPNLVMPPVSVTPPDIEVGSAKTLITRVLLHDFPFVSESDLAHAVAGMFLPFVRAMITGPTPLHLILAPVKGTGKTLLSEAITHPAAGRVGVTTEARNEDEWRKRIGAWLASGPPVISIDNLKNKLDSAALSAVLTEELWVDRYLGRNDKTIRYPNQALWIATGNGVTLSDELTRRTIPINLDAGVEHPYLRDTEAFLFPDLRGWMRQQRGLLIWACTTLIQRWISDGRPLGTATIGSYESWAKTMGGILGVVGIDGFLTNLDEFYASSDPETVAWNALIASWWESYQGTAVRPGELLDQYDTLADDFLALGEKSDRLRASSLGNKLLAQRNRIFAGYRLVLVDTNQGGNRWRLQPKGS